MYRIEPRGGPQAYKTYALSAPRATHTRPATCAEIECPAHVHGWAVTVSPGSADEGAIQSSGRHFLQPESQPGGFVRYVFPPGQACFRASEHRVPLERPALYVVRGGDWRANTGVIRRHANGDDWVDDFRTHQDKIATVVNRG